MPSARHDFGVQPVLPHIPASPPPPHVSGATQVPQERTPPQPSAQEPHVNPRPVQVFGVQVVPPQLPATPPPPHVVGATQVPRLSVPPQPSAQVPQS